MLMNPALAQLLREQRTAKLRRLLRNLQSRRKLLLTVAALLLAVFWLGNAVASILFRTPYPVETVRNGIVLSLMAYSLWQVIRVAWQRPEAPIEWSPSEREFLEAGPFSRREILTYRLATVMTATAVKAACAALLLIPDLPVWPVGFVGIFLALACIELLRMSLEIATHGISPRLYRGFQAVVFGGLFVGVCYVLSAVLRDAPAESARSTTHLLRRLLTGVTELRATAAGRVWESLFTPFGEMITTTDFVSWGFLNGCLFSLLVVGGLTVVVICVDGYFQSSTVQAERRRYTPEQQSSTAARSRASRSSVRLPRVPQCRGAGPLGWRQFVGAMKHRAGLLLVFTAPAGLSLIPLLQPLEPQQTFLHVTAGLVFYSFLLLPAALKFDFRRDYDRLYALKLLPVSSAATVCGQLATPVILTSCFQTATLIAAFCLRPVSPALFVASVAILLPLNVIIYALENLIFLLSPHRVKQEGFEVFLRTILVFTAKGILFVIALLAVLVGIRSVQAFCRFATTAWNLPLDFRIAFSFVLEAAVVLTAVVLTKLLIRVYQRFDPTLDASV